MKNKCDIIIPIYNAYEALVECVKSVINSTDLFLNTLILINDCSPDERISQYINEVKARYSDINITVLENEENLGFVGTVNRGMKCSSSDVLLLNSDTIVSAGWLEKIQRCAYSQPDVATVTAMSNNATLASVPKGLQRNEIPKDITIEEYNKIIEKCSYREYPQLPTAHGFCMYIKRSVLDVVGFFDAETFGRGYGEENDFSYRCNDFGYKHLLCDDTIVYHLESMSFKKERQAIIEEHSEILKKRYPEYTLQTDNWCIRFPIKKICKNIDYNLQLVAKKNVLILIHEWDNVVGGTTLHVKDLISGLKDKYNFHVLFPVGENYVIESYFGDSVQRININTGIIRISRYDRYNKIYRKMIEGVIKAFAIDTLHVHHFIGHYFDVIDVAKNNYLNTVITLHDYYSVCPSINMLYCGKDYCGKNENKDCSKCLSETGRARNDIVKEWQKAFKDVLKEFDTVIVPSDDTNERISDVYEGIKITTIEHGVNISKNNYSPKVNGKLNVAFIGVLCAHKGGLETKQLIENCKNKNIVFHAFGKSEISELEKNRENYIFHGAYDRAALNDLLWKHNIHVICFLPKWPETYSYTLNEAVAAGIPVISSNIGAGAQRVKKYGLGWLVEIERASEEILKLCNDILNDASEYGRVLDNIANYRIKSIPDMTAEYDLIYNTVSGKDIDHEALRALIADDCEEVNNTSQNIEAQLQLNEIINSTKWRIISSIKIPKAISVPLKKVLKSFLRLVKR